MPISARRSWRAGGRRFGAALSPFIGGSIFDLECAAIVSPANSFGIMDGGLDGKLRDFFGLGIETAVRGKIAAEFGGELLVGQALAVETGHARFPYLVAAPTMRLPADVSQSINAYLAMRALLRVALAHPNIDSIAVPGLATLSGRMPPDVAAWQMRAGFDYVLNGAYRFSHWRFERDFEDYLKGKTSVIPVE